MPCWQRMSNEMQCLHFYFITLICVQLLITSIFLSLLLDLLMVSGQMKALEPLTGKRCCRLENCCFWTRHCLPATFVFKLNLSTWSLWSHIRETVIVSTMILVISRVTQLAPDCPSALLFALFCSETGFPSSPSDLVKYSKCFSIQPVQSSFCFWHIAG